MMYILFIPLIICFSYFRTVVLARGGLKAAEAAAFIRDRVAEIRHFSPTHIVLHVGFCDLQPKTLLEAPKKLPSVLIDIKACLAYLKELVPGAEVLFSEPLPRCIANKPYPRPGIDYSSWNNRWRSYNRQVRSGIRKKHAEQLNLIPHKQFWFSCSAGDHSYFKADETWYCLHMNAKGYAAFLRNIFRAVQ